MAIKNTRYHVHNGTDFDTYHYETQAKQVKVLDGTGAVLTDLEELLLTGRPLTNPDLNTVLDTGLYKITGAINVPTGLDVNKSYPLNIKSVDNGSGVKTVYQEIIDVTNQSKFTRIIEGSTVGEWEDLGHEVLVLIDELRSDLGETKALETTNKTSIVDAINEVKASTDSNSTNIENNVVNITGLRLDLDSHNHDDRYLQLTGGNLTGTTSMANGFSFAGKDNSGSNVNLAQVDSSNNSVFGSDGQASIIHAKSGNLTVFDGAKSYKVFHEGNDGHGSKFDADTIDGIEGTSIARNDQANSFNGTQTVTNGNNVLLKASSGSSQAGSLIFQAGDGTQKAKVSTNVSGDILITAGTISGHTFQAGGQLFSTYTHVLDATNREVRTQFTKSGDAGIGHYMNTTGGYGLYDWENSENIYSIDRSEGVVQFSHSIRLAGRKLTIQTGEPANPNTGDIWFDI